MEYLYKAGRYVHNLAEKLVGKPWVQDGITSHEASVIGNLYLLARAQDDSLESETNAIAAGLADMPFLDSIEGADRQAMESLRKLERDNTARFLEVMDHPVINDGITDQETKLVALLWGTNTYKPEYVDDVLTQNRDLCGGENDKTADFRRGLVGCVSPSGPGDAQHGLLGAQRDLHGGHHGQSASIQLFGRVFH